MQNVIRIIIKKISGVFRNFEEDDMGNNKLKL